MSFRLKTILGIALIESVLLLVLILSSLHALRSSNEDELIKRSYTAARLFATTTTDAVLAYDLASLESAVAQVLRNPGIQYARVRDRDGRVLAAGGTSELLTRPFNADTDYEGVTDGVFDTDAMISVADMHYGKVELGVSTDVIEAVIARTRGRLVAIAVAEMLLVALFSYVLAHYLMRGLRALTEASSRIAAGAFGYQVEVAGRDELAQAARAFNAMSRELEALQAERTHDRESLRRLNEDLELRVALRTQELAQANEDLEVQALSDALTKIPNRKLLLDRLGHAIEIGQREQKPLALVMLDLNGFKEINDTFGHHTGDLVLREVAKRLRTCMRRSDTVARLGGDEFAILLPGVKDEDAALAIARKLAAAVALPVDLDGHAVDVGASYGIALCPHHGADANTLLRQADIAMYEAKRNKTGCMVYRPEFDQNSAARLTLQGELRNAVARGELVLHFQPLVNFVTGRVSGAEALVRWQHPQHGLLYPDDFLPLAERSGIMKAITEGVLAAALRQCRAWRDSGVPLTIAVNISFESIQDPDFPSLVQALLQETGVRPEWLELEITETAIMSDPVRAIDGVSKLSALGVQLSIDDFGTGYSSLVYLKRLPIDRIKIDRSFVTDMLVNTNDAVIVRSIAGLARNLGLEVVAEGIESADVWSELKALGCDTAQGYHISKPLAPAAFDAWLRTCPWSPLADGTRIAARS